MRRGEILGLEWQHVDAEKKIFDIQQTSPIRPRKRDYHKTAKNETSKRLIAVPDAVMELLKQFKAEQKENRLSLGDKWQNSNRIFTTWNGTPMFPDSFNNWLTEFVEDHNLPHQPTQFSAYVGDLCSSPRHKFKICFFQARS